jgi:hypothetical protein
MPGSDVSSSRQAKVLESETRRAKVHASLLEKTRIPVVIEDPDMVDQLEQAQPRHGHSCTQQSKSMLFMGNASTAKR